LSLPPDPGLTPGATLVPPLRGWVKASKEFRDRN
jgi:hypothetical protein